MDRPTRKRGGIVAAPTEALRPGVAAPRVYAVARNDTIGEGPTIAPALSWPDWTDRVRYTVTRTWPEGRPGGDA